MSYNVSMGALSRRLERESKTLAAMLRMYCASRHGGRELCPECAGLLAYARKRLAACPFGARKPACSGCAVHCYEAGRRAGIREVMRFAGPRLPARHPYLALRHLWDGWRGAP